MIIKKDLTFCLKLVVLDLWSGMSSTNSPSNDQSKGTQSKWNPMECKTVRLPRKRLTSIMAFSYSSPNTTLICSWLNTWSESFFESFSRSTFLLWSIFTPSTVIGVARMKQRNRDLPNCSNFRYPFLWIVRKLALCPVSWSYRCRESRLYHYA